MKIFGICLVKNEADIIVETLRHAARWCDRIFVFDNGSTDQTWGHVLEMARAEPRVVPYKSEAVPFRDSLRMEIFNHFRDEASDGDWWCRLDADEMYYDDPRAFLTSVPRRHHVVWGVNFQFYFTDADVARWTQDPHAYPPHQPAESSLRHYRCDYSEIRFFRHRPGLVWDHGSFPRHLGVVHPRRIRFKHYQYRSPGQIEQRLRTRQEAMASGCDTFHDYCRETDWREKVVPVATCRSVDASIPFTIEEALLPRHVEPLHVRALKLMLHCTRIWP